METASQSSAPLPKIDFTTFILSVSSAAFIGLGLVPSEPGARPEVNLELARHNIDLLELIFERTRGNRSSEEDRLIEQLLFETRMRFVEVQKSSESQKEFNEARKNESK